MKELFKLTIEFTRIFIGFILAIMILGTFDIYYELKRLYEMKIKNYPNYNITKDGKVINNKTNKELKPRIDKYGYYKVSLSYNGVAKENRIHRLLALTYLPNPENKSDVNHIDGNKSNNDLSNLEWATRSENVKHAFNNGLKIITNKQRLLTKERCSKMVLDTQTGIFYNSAVEASNLLGIKESTLYGYLKGRRTNKTSLIYV